MTKQRWILLVSVLAGCSHSGSGEGELQTPHGASSGQEQDGEIVRFDWQSGADPSEGTISATMPDGERFSGTFVQPSHTTWQPRFDNYYTVWSSPTWGIPGPWYTGPRNDFVTHYSGKAIAHLDNTSGTRMRCTFELFHANDGLAGGGEGDCQLSNHERVFDAVLTAH